MSCPGVQVLPWARGSLPGVYVRVRAHQRTVPCQVALRKVHHAERRGDIVPVSAGLVCRPNEAPRGEPGGITRGPAFALAFKAADPKTCQPPHPTWTHSAETGIRRKRNTWPSGCSACHGQRRRSCWRLPGGGANSFPLAPLHKPAAGAHRWPRSHLALPVPIGSHCVGCGDTCLLGCPRLCHRPATLQVGVVARGLPACLMPCRPLGIPAAEEDTPDEAGLHFWGLRAHLPGVAGLCSAAASMFPGP
mmetsp:Transcript_27249/g.78533  ORF Transcript_27249/g.78533 Transcript_27249/m.78533 type:complete len:248 (-) Transcript_27249:221-964(-)